MPFVEMPLEDAKEASIVPESYYDLRVVSYKEIVKEETGRVGYMAYIQVENPPESVPNPQLISQYLGTLLPDDEASTKNMIMLTVRRFCEAFNIPYERNGWNPDDLPGATANVFVKEGSYNGNPTNELELPRCKDE